MAPLLCLEIDVPTNPQSSDHTPIEKKPKDEYKTRHYVVQLQEELLLGTHLCHVEG